MAGGADYPGAIWMPTTQRWVGRSGHQIRYIIIHGTAWPGPASAQDIGAFFQHPDRPTSTHFVIGKDGTVVQCVSVADSAWGNGIVTQGHDPWWGTRGNPNLETISIEHVKWLLGPDGKPDNHDALTEPQWEASFHLIQWLCDKYNIPRQAADETGGITGHYSIDPVNRKYCPGPYPWQDLIDALNNPGTPPGFHFTGYVPATGNAPTAASAQAMLATGNSAAPGGTPGSSGLTPAQRAHDVLQELPGFGGVAGALDAAAQFSPLSGSGVPDVAGWVGNNMTAFALRAVLIAVGVALALALLFALMRKNQWIGDAGLDVLPLTMHASNRQSRPNGASEF